MFGTRGGRFVAASALVAASSGALLAVAATPASADPVNAPTPLLLNVVCDNGETYSAEVSPGNGSFTPAFDVNSTTMLIPLSFGPQTFTIRDTSGNIVFQSTSQPRAKGNATSAPNRDTKTACTFTGGGFDPATNTTFTISGSVVGFVTPA